MTTLPRMRLWFFVLIVWAIAFGARAQVPAQEYTPELGQAGKDVIWLPSPQVLVEQMLDMAKVAPGDFLMDLGSGDGRTVIAAAKRGVRALGVEYNADMVGLSRRRAAAAGVSDKAKFVRADIFETDLSQATVITLFLLQDLNLRLRPKLLSMKPGTRVVSNSFDMGAWEPDRTMELGCDTYCTAYLWIVPARVQGKWRLDQGDLVLIQTFQRITGSIGNGRGVETIDYGRLRGNEISFAAGGAQYRGHVEGKMMRGTVMKDGMRANWIARR